MTYKCRVCGQPITREMAVLTKAGGFTDGYCARHAPESADVSSTILTSEEKGGNNGNEVQSGGLPPQD